MFNRPEFFNPMFGGKFGADPLGIALQDRAQQARQAQRMQDFEYNTGSLGLGSAGPLPSAAWDGLFQAMAERGVRRAGQSSGTAALGPTYDPGFQTSAVDQANANSFASPYHGQSLDRRATATRQLLPGYGGPEAAMTALRNAGPGRMPQAHNDWMEENAPGGWSIRQVSSNPGGAYRRSRANPVISSPTNQYSRYSRPNPNE